MGFLSGKREDQISVAPFRLGLQPLSFEPTWTVPAELMYIDGQTARSWISGAKPFPPTVKNVHWNNRVHLECLKRWFIDTAAVPAMAHLLDPTFEPVRQVYRSYGYDPAPEAARILVAQCVALAAVDVDLGLPDGMSNPVVNCNIRHFANARHRSLADRDATAAALSRWAIWALYFQLRWDTPEYSVPEILAVAKQTSSASAPPLRRDVSS